MIKNFPTYTNKDYVYAVREILPGCWFIQVYWRNPNGRRGGVCRLMDELDGPTYSSKVFDSPLKAQKYLDDMAKLYDWDLYVE